MSNNLKDKGRFASDIKGLHFDTNLADFLLKCGGKSFPCHKGILCARSAVFERMLAQGWDEAKNGEATVDDVEPEVLGMMLEFIYSGEVVSMEGRADELLYAADKYGLEGLVRYVIIIGPFLSTPLFLEPCDDAAQVKLCAAECLAR